MKLTKDLAVSQQSSWWEYLAMLIPSILKWMADSTSPETCGLILCSSWLFPMGFEEEDKVIFGSASGKGYGTLWTTSRGFNSCPTWINLGDYQYCAEGEVKQAASWKALLRDLMNFDYNYKASKFPFEKAWPQLRVHFMKWMTLFPFCSNSDLAMRWKQYWLICFLHSLLDRKCLPELLLLHLSVTFAIIDHGNNMDYRWNQGHQSLRRLFLPAFSCV